MKRSYAVVAALLLLGTLLAYNNCGNSNTFTSVKGTEITNPMTPVSNQVLYALCGVITRCNSQVTIDACQRGVLATSGFATPLGVSSTYNTFSSIVQGEQSGALLGNSAASNTCYASINSLSCTDPSVVGAYDANLSNPFVGTPNMIPSASCNEVFSPGINLEVPIELVDFGVSSNTAPITFSRTRTSLNTLDYDGTVTYSFEVVASNSDAIARHVSLVDSANNAVATVAVASGSNSVTRLRVPFTPTSGANNYRVVLDGTNTVDQLVVYEGRILVDQKGATQTKVYVPLTGGHVGWYSHNDNSTCAVDDGVTSSATGVYAHDNEQYFSLWKKNASAFSQISQYTFEAVIGTSIAGSTTAYASLFDATTGNQVVASEVSTTSATPALLTANLTDGAANFTDLDNIEMRIKNDGTGQAWIYRSGLWIKLTNLSHAEVYYRYGLTLPQNNPGGSALYYPLNMMLLDMTLFNAPTSVYHESTGQITAAGVGCSENALDVGTTDSVINGSVSGVAVSSSTLSFATTARTRNRTGALMVTSGDRHIGDVLPTSGTGICYIIQPRVVVAF